MQRSYRAFYCLVLTTVALAGCAKPLKICPGKGSVAEAISVLTERSKNAVPFKANGRCRLEYYVEDNPKPKKESFFVQFWVNPPSEIYLQGNVAFDARGLVAGLNKDEFWFFIRPKEISGYWWGRWSEKIYFRELMVSPKIVLEALGIAVLGGDEDSRENWSLSDEGAFDVLTKRNEQGRILKKVHIYRCDYLVHKIEYFDVDGRPSFVAKLRGYQKRIKGFLLPGSIEIIRITGSGKEDSVKIAVTSAKSADFSPKLRDALFTRPEPRGFEHVFRNENGIWVEER